MQTITQELRDLLKSKLQIGDNAFAGRIEIGGQSYPCSQMTIDSSLRMQADQLTVLMANEALQLGWGPTNIFPTNTRIKAFQWFGDPANEVQTFDGVIDNPVDHRDVLTMTLNARDRFAILIDQTFQAFAAQEADADDNDRTENNGVYLNREVDYILNDILDRAGWPTADRDIQPTSIVLTEFVLEDGTSYADNITGDNRLTTLTGFSAWADQLGVFQFKPTPSSDIVQVPAVPTYTWRSGEDMLEFGNSTDQYELITRVRTRGPVQTTQLTPAWQMVWQTRKISRPVGIWYDPAFPSSIRVIDATTKRLFTIRDSDHQVISSVYLGSAILYPLGISGDPSDSTHYYVLNAPWYYGGGTSGNSVKKVRKSDNVVVGTFALPSGRWSALKISASYAYLTNLDTDRFYRRDKTDMSAIANYQHVYQSVTQTNPSGMMIDGTTLMLFWANGGTTARFLHCEESAPTVITDVTKTAGSTLHGGEMNTDTHIDCWGDSDSAGLTAKFHLQTTTTTTVNVTSEAVDTELEDELGANAELEDREHDTHPGDPDHPWESRRLNLDLSAIDNLAQAADIAAFWLGKLGQRRQVVDAGIIGNPAVQKNDLVRVEDPKTGHRQNLVLDTYHSEMGETFFAVVSLVRGGVANDEITEPDPPPTDDGGDASDGEPFYAGSFPFYGDADSWADAGESVEKDGGSLPKATHFVNLAPDTTYSYDIVVDSTVFGSYAKHLHLGNYINDPLATTVLSIAYPLIPNDISTVHFTGTFTTPDAAHTVNPYAFRIGVAQDPHGHNFRGTVTYDVEPV